MTLMKRYTYLNGQLLVRELSDCNDNRKKTRAPRNVIRMKKVPKPSPKEQKSNYPSVRLTNAEDEPLLRKRRERERGNVAS